MATVTLVLDEEKLKEIAKSYAWVNAVWTSHDCDMVDQTGCAVEALADAMEMFVQVPAVQAALEEAWREALMEYEDVEFTGPVTVRMPSRGDRYGDDD